jgi:bifunctional ADP-heptose synthase (sugar kinase/adenylyltransferase)
LEAILTNLPSLHVAVVGDLFLDRYFDLDARLTEPSVETGLDAYQVVRVRSSPGAAGTVLNNLVALGVGRVSILSVIGDDGEGFELRRELTRRGIDQSWLLGAPDRFTPTYLKPLLGSYRAGSVSDGSSRAGSVSDRCSELNRFDTKNRTPLPPALEEQLLTALPRVLAQAAAVVVVDQVSEPECGVVTTRLRQRLAELGEASPRKFILADSRSRIGLFRSVCVKPNEAECGGAGVSPAGGSGGAGVGGAGVSPAIAQLAQRVGRAVFCTRGSQGILLATPEGDAVRCEAIPGYPVTGPIDPVGAGDSASAGIACAVAAGASYAEAAAFGCLVASVTVRQLGTTGTATPEQVREAAGEGGTG